MPGGSPAQAFAKAGEILPAFLLRLRVATFATPNTCVV
jgi:hypothetical protein